MSGMLTILQLLEEGTLSERASRGVEEGADQTVYRTFVSPEYEWDGSRYIYDVTRCARADGWRQFDTDQDAWYFGVWWHPERWVIVTYAEGDETIVVCHTAEAFGAELASMVEFYGDPPAAVVAIDMNGTVTHYFDEEGRP